MTKQDFIAYCQSIGVTPHFRSAADAPYRRAGVDYIVTLFFDGRDQGDWACRDEEFGSIKPYAEWVAGLRRALPGSPYEQELTEAGESLFVADDAR